MSVMQACMDACSACEQACTVCSTQMMDLRPGVHELRGHVQHDDARHDADAGHERRPSMMSMLDACMAMCQICMDECMKHADMSEVCKMCAQSCQACMDACMAVKDMMMKMA